MTSEKGLGSYSAFSSVSSSSAPSTGGFSFKPSALAPLTTHINTKVVTTANPEVAETPHTAAVLKFLSSKKEDLLNEDSKGEETTSQGSDKQKSFVFGKNLNSRVVNVVHSPPHESEATLEKSTVEEKTTTTSDKVKEGQKSPDELDSTDGEKGSIFLTASKGLIKQSPAGVVTGSTSPSSSSAIVSQSAESLLGVSTEKSVFQTPETLNAFNFNRLPPPVASLETGEENEDTLFHATCKLHVFDSQKNTWLERGRGLVKINRDRTTQKCRIVMRQQGIFRLLLNSPIFAGMRLKQVSARGIHVTAAEVDTGAMRVFLLTSTTPTEAQHLFHYLTRLVAEAEEAEEKPKTQEHNQEWHAAESTRASKHGRQTGSDRESVRNSREDINKIASSSSGGQKQLQDELQQRTTSGALRRGSAGNFQAQQSDESGEEDDSGHDLKAKRALTVLPPKSTNTNEDSNTSNSNSRGSFDDNGSDGSDVGEEEEEPDEEEGSGLDDSLSSNSAASGGVANNTNKPDPVVYSAETSNASLDLKRPRLLGTNAVDDAVSEEDNKATIENQ